MIDFTEKFSALEKEMTGNLKKISIGSAIKVYYGINPEGGLRLCFMSKTEPPKIDSTKLIRVSHFEEKSKMNWLYFDLIDLQAKHAFYALCGSLINAVEDDNYATEDIALTSLKNRFYLWKKLLKKDSCALTEEMSKGLFGELYFLLHTLIPKIGITDSIDAWSGPEGYSKDFAVSGTWYELKTISASAISIKISSLQQLSATAIGHLVIIKVDAMVDKFGGAETSINGLVNSILGQITVDETREQFIEKLVKYGYCIGDLEHKRYQVLSMNSYLVDTKFPRFLEDDVKHSEIAKVSYELIINSLEKYKEV